MSQIDLLFLGTGTSAGIPMIGCYCDVCPSPNPCDQRTRPSNWIPIPLFPGHMPIFGVRVCSLAYCTDVIRIPDESFDLLKNLDVLVLDGLQFHAHPTHFSIPEAIETAAKIGAKMTYLTH